MLDGPAGDEVAALVRLAPGAPPPPGVRVVARFGDVATVRLRRGDLLATRAESVILSIKASRDVRPEPATPGREGGPRRAASRRWPGAGAPTGRGSLIGVVDWGCDFAHPNLLSSTGRTRLLALWDQRASRRRPPSPYGYGVVHDAAAIDRALGARDPFDALGYDPVDVDVDGSGTHGTHVLDIAAGAPRVGPGGVAPGADLVFVHLANPPSGPRGIGSSVSLVEAVHFIARTAAGRPWVVNLSLGSHCGPHDGTTLVEQALDAVVTERPGQSVVQSCGNYALRPIHATGRLRAGERAAIDWRVDPTDQTENEVEVWYPGSDALVIELVAPDGTRVVHAPPDSHGPIVYRRRTVGRFAHRTRDPNNGDHHASLRLDPVGGGDWRVVLKALTVVSGEYHVWVERDELRPGSQSRLSRAQAVPTGTTGTICNGRHTIAVGAHDPATGALAPFSSKGPTRDGREKPDVTAPGIGILAARSEPDGHGEGDAYLTAKSGTSMASPHVAGTVALLYEAAGRPLAADEVRRILVETAKPLAGGGRATLGRLDITAAVARARSGPSAPEAIVWPEDVFLPIEEGPDAIPLFSRVFHSGGISYRAIDRKQTWTGNQELAPQMTRVVLAGLVTPEALTPALTQAATPIVRVGDWGGANVGRKTRDKEPIGHFNVMPNLGLVLVAWLELVQNVTPSISPEERGRLERALVVSLAFHWHSKAFEDDPWITEELLRGFAWSRRRLVDDVHAAIDWKQWREQVLVAIGRQDPTLMPWAPQQPRSDALRTAVDRLIDAWNRATDPLVAIREDRALVPATGYRYLWKVKEGQQASAKTAVHADEVRLFMTFAELRDPTLAREAVAPENSGARKQLLERFARYSRVASKYATRAPATGELSEAPGLANAPPLPSQLATSPTVSAPDFFLPVGAEVRASMELNFPDVYEAFREFGYRWELVRVPQEMIEKAIVEARTKGQELGQAEITVAGAKASELGSKETGEDAPGLGAALANQVDRRGQYARTDVARVVADLDTQLGPAAMGAGSLVAMGAIAGFVGEVILSAIEWLTAKRHEKRIALREPGVYILRCIATPVLLDNATLLRPPSAAYLPLWVRPIEEVADAEADRQLGQLVKVRKGMQELEALLKDPKQASQEIQVQYNQLKLESQGAVHDVLQRAFEVLSAKIEAFRTNLATATGALKRRLEADLKKVEEHRDDFRERLGKRAHWYGQIGLNASDYKDLVRFRGVLVTDEGQIVQLLADAWRNPRTREYHVFDSTDKRGGTKSARDDNPAVAVRNALQALLESDAHNHGRGRCTIDVPSGGSQWVRQSFRADLDSTAALVHSLEATVQLATAIALIFVAFTPVSAAALLLPLGIIGAIPSAYRVVTRASEGSVGFDLSHAMDVVNILGSATAVGQVAARGLRLVRLSGGLMVTGIGYDGLGMLMLGVEVGNQIEAIQDQPSAARHAKIARIVSGSLGQIGLTKVAGMLGRYAEHQRAKAAGGAETPVPLDRASAAVNQQFKDLVGAPVPVHIDPDPKAATRPPIRFERDGYRLPSQVRLELPEAKVESFQDHARPMRTLVEIDRLSAGVRRLTDNLEGMRGRGQKFPERSRAGDASRAIDAAPDQLFEMAEQVAKGTLQPADAEARLKTMQQALAGHEIALHELAAGDAFLRNRAAAAQRAVAAGYEKPPRGHYVIDGPDGTFALRRQADSNEPERRYDAKTKKVAPAGVAPPTVPKRPVDTPTGTTHTTTPRPTAGFDPALVQFEAEKMLPKPVVVRPPVAGQDDVRVKPPRTTGGDYIITAPAGASHGAVMKAVAEHVRLARMRPAQPEGGGQNRRVAGRGAAWSGAEEAAYRGYPGQEPGQRWVWRGGDIAYQRASKNSAGRSYDRAGDRFGPPQKKETGPPKFAAGDDPMEALGANDPNSDFGRWVAAVTGENDVVGPLLGLKPGEGLPVPGGQGHVSRDWLRQRIGDPTGRTHASVRDALKKPFRPTLARALADQKALRKFNAKLAAQAEKAVGRPKVDPRLTLRRVEQDLADARLAVAQEKELILSAHGEAAWNQQARALTKPIFNLLERKHGLHLQSNAPAHHRVLFDVQVVAIHLETFNGVPVSGERRIDLRKKEHGGVDRTFDNVVFVAGASGEVLGVQPHELKSGGALTKSGVLPSSVKGGINEGDLAGHFRDGSTIQKQLNMTQTLKRRAAEAQGELVLRGRDVLTGEVVEIRVKPDRVHTERVEVYPVSAQHARVPLGADADAVLTKRTEALVDRQLGHESMIDMAHRLGPSEGRRVALDWYERSFAPADRLPPAATGARPAFDAMFPRPAAGGAGAAPVTPVVGVLVHARPGFNARDRKRYARACRTAGQQPGARGQGRRVAVTEFRQVFLHPEVAVKHADWIAGRLFSGDPVEFHLFSRIQTDAVWSSREVQARRAEQGLTSRALADEIRAFAGGSLPVAS